MNTVTYNGTPLIYGAGGSSEPAWESKTWNGLTNFYGSYIWTDGDNIYYDGYVRGRFVHYILNKSTPSSFAIYYNP